MDRLAVYIAKTELGLRGFGPANLFRTKQFYGIHRDEPIVSPPVTQLPWSHHLVILGLTSGLGADWYQLPIPDAGIPDESFEHLWSDVGSRLRGLLKAG